MARMGLWSPSRSSGESKLTGRRSPAATSPRDAGVTIRAGAPMRKPSESEVHPQHKEPRLHHHCFCISSRSRRKLVHVRRHHLPPSRSCDRPTPHLPGHPARRHAVRPPGNSRRSENARRPLDNVEAEYGSVRVESFNVWGRSRIGISRATPGDHPPSRARSSDHDFQYHHGADVPIGIPRWIFDCHGIPRFQGAGRFRRRRSGGVRARS